MFIHCDVVKPMVLSGLISKLGISKVAHVVACNLDTMLCNELMRRAQLKGAMVPGAYRTDGHQVSKDSKHFAVELFSSIQDHLHPHRTMSE